MSRTLEYKEARSFYDGFGAKQDKQGWYETPALDLLKTHGQFQTAQSVFELGCGTGKLARELLQHSLGAEAHYTGVDLSPVMIGLTKERLSAYRARIELVITDGSSNLPAAANSADRFIACYILDLLSTQNIDLMIAEAHRILKPDGLLCIAGLTPGPTPLTKVVSKTWSGLHKLNPMLVGGCRPITITDHLPEDTWELEHCYVVKPFGLSSEVIIAKRIN